MELVVEEDGVQLELVEVQDVLQVALELKELSPALVDELLGDSILGVVGHDAGVSNSCSSLAAGTRLRTSIYTAVYHQSGGA